MGPRARGSHLEHLRCLVRRAIASQRRGARYGGISWGVVCATATLDTFSVFGGESQGPTSTGFLRCVVGRALALQRRGARYGSISWGVVRATATWDTLALFGGASQGPTPPGFLHCLVGRALAFQRRGALWQHFLGRRACHRDLGHVSGAWWDRKGRRCFVLYVVWWGGRLRHIGVGRGSICSPRLGTR